MGTRESCRPGVGALGRKEAAWMYCMSMIYTQRARATSRRCGDVGGFQISHFFFFEKKTVRIMPGVGGVRVGLLFGYYFDGLRMYFPLGEKISTLEHG